MAKRNQGLPMHERERMIMAEMLPSDQFAIIDNPHLVLISAKWWNQWEIYCQNGEIRPGPIDNDHLMTSDTHKRLQAGLMQTVDYVAVTLPAWEKFKIWYSGGPKIQVQVIDGCIDTDPIVLQVYKNNVKNDPIDFLISKDIKIYEAWKIICSEYSIQHYQHFYLVQIQDFDAVNQEYTSRSLRWMQEMTIEQVDLTHMSRVVLQEKENTAQETFSGNDKPHGVTFGDVVSSTYNNDQEEDDLNAAIQASLRDVQDTSTTTGQSDFELSEIRYGLRQDREFMEERLVESSKVAKINPKVRNLSRIRENLEELMNE